MRPALTTRLTDELLARLKEMFRRTGLPVGRIIRHQFERAKAEKGSTIPESRGKDQRAIRFVFAGRFPGSMEASTIPTLS
jgi:hypothetical protein